MIDFFINGQSIKHYSPVIAADTLDVIEAEFHFTDFSWDGYTRWVHFKHGDTVYDVELNAENRLTADSGVNLTAGEWTVYLTGTKGSSRMTTVPCLITVRESGLREAPLHAIPLSAAEQIDTKASTALAMAMEVKAAAERGDFDGECMKVYGYFGTLSALTDAVTDPEPGDMYGIGEAAPYRIYAWDGVNMEWVDNGEIQGARGQRGLSGATYTPAVDPQGNLTWTNDGGLANPPARSIMGPKGDTGTAGADGKTPYELAVEEGYTGTEATFNAAIKDFPAHGGRHSATGADPVVVKTDNLEDDAVTKSKLAPGATNTQLTLSLTAAGWEDKQQTVSALGVTADNTVIVSPAPASFTAYGGAGIRATAQGADELTFTCDTVPDAEITVNVGVLR